MVSEFDVTVVPQQPALSISKKIPATEIPSVVGAAFGKIENYLKEIGEVPAGPPYIAYFNDDMESLDMEIGLPVNHPVLGLNQIEANKTIGGRVASCIYKGPYSEIGEAYGELTQFVKGKGLKTKGIACEIYLNDPAETLPEELLTKVMFVLE